MFRVLACSLLCLLLAASSVGLKPDVTTTVHDISGFEQSELDVSKHLSEQGHEDAETTMPDDEDSDAAQAWLVFALIAGVIFAVWFLYRRKDLRSPSERSSGNPPARHENKRLRTTSSQSAKQSSAPKVRRATTSAPPKPPNEPSASPFRPYTSEVQLQVQKGDTQQTAIKKTKESPDPQRIGYTPSGRFIQKEPYVYPVAKMPMPACVVKFPRKGGRTGNRGFTEHGFELHLRNFFGEYMQVYNDRRMVIAPGKRPYEPDLVLSNEEGGRNLFIDVEIDEPYSGAAMPQPLHSVGGDEQRDNFFVNRGWIVIRFAEIQVHTDPTACCRFIAEVTKSVCPRYSVPTHLESVELPNPVEQWSVEQAQQWIREKYREEYLGIGSFGKQDDYEVQPVADETLEEAETEAHVKVSSARSRTKGNKVADARWLHPRDAHISFDAEDHQYYIHGSSNVVSVTELVQSFFPEFDAKHVSERIANRSHHPGSKYYGMSAQDIQAKWKHDAQVSREAGKALHDAIAQNLKGTKGKSTLPGMGHFHAFMQDHDSFDLQRAEWRIYDEEAMVAGTLDALFRDACGRLVLCDWTRSKQIKRQNDWQSGLKMLDHLPDANYWHKAVQLSLYTAILRERYNCIVDRQYLVGLHPGQNNFQKFELPILADEASALFETRRAGL